MPRGGGPRVLEELLPLVVYISLLGPFSMLVSDLAFGLFAGPSYLESRSQLEALIAELRGGEVSRRRLQRLRSRLVELRLRLRRLVMLRLAFLAPVYAAVAIAVLRGVPPLPIPVRCCVPLLTVATEKGCFTFPGLVAALSFIAALPLMQEDLVVALAARLRGGRG